MIDLFRPFMSDGARVLVQKVLSYQSDGRLYIGEGQYVQEFERILSATLGQETPPLLSVNSCTSALDLSLHLVGVKPGSEVITTPMTCTATNGVIVNRRAKIVWADVDPLTGLIDPLDVRKKITKNTKAIIGVDWAGNPANYLALKAFGLPVIQDAAHSFYIDRHNHGDYVALSFQAIKHLTTTDGGALLVPPDQFDRARLLRWYGLDRTTGAADFRCEQDITEAGYKYHMNNVAAAQGLGNLPYMSRNLSRCRENAEFYSKVLRGAPGIKTPQHTPGHSWWLYTILVDEPMAMRAWLKSQGVDASPVHARNDVHTAFKAAAKSHDELPGVNAFASHELAIPVGWWVTPDDRELVAAKVLGWADARGQSQQKLEPATV